MGAEDKEDDEEDVDVKEGATADATLAVFLEEDLEENLDDWEAGADDCNVFRFFLPVVKGSNWCSALVQTVPLYDDPQLSKVMS